MASSSRKLLGQIVPYLYLGGGACTALAMLYPQTVGLEQYKNAVAIMSPDGVEEEVDKEILKMAEEIAEKLEWTQEQKDKTKLFPCVWIDFVHMGSCVSRWGAFIGVPGHVITSLNLVEKMTLSGKLGKFNIDFALPPGQNLQTSLEMMSKAKKFSLAKEMCEVDSKFNALMAVLTGASIPGAYFTTKLFQIVTGVYKNKATSRASYVLVFPTFFLFSVFLKDTVTCKRQEKIDDKLLALGPDMAQNGYNYYSALLMRNQALLTLVGKTGASYITYYGNKRNLFRKPEPLLTERRDKMLQYLENSGVHK